MAFENGINMYGPRPIGCMCYVADTPVCLHIRFDTAEGYAAGNSELEMCAAIVIPMPLFEFGLTCVSCPGVALSASSTCAGQT